MQRKWVTDILEKANECFYCERIFLCPDHSKNAGIKTLDHIIPQVIGGRHIPKNIVVSCTWCNGQKGEKSLAEFYKHIEALKETISPCIKSAIELDLILFKIRQLEWLIKPYEKHLINKLHNSFSLPSDNYFNKNEIDLSEEKFYKLLATNTQNLANKVKKEKEKQKIDIVKELLSQPEPNFHYI